MISVLKVVALEPAPRVERGSASGRYLGAEREIEIPRIDSYRPDKVRLTASKGISSSFREDVYRTDTKEMRDEGNLKRGFRLDDAVYEYGRFILGRRIWGKELDRHRASEAGVFKPR